MVAKQEHWFLAWMVAAGYFQWQALPKLPLSLSLLMPCVCVCVCVHHRSVCMVQGRLADADAAQHRPLRTPCGASLTLLTIALAARVVQCAVHSLVAALKATCGQQGCVLIFGIVIMIWSQAGYFLKQRFPGHGST